MCMTDPIADMLTRIRNAGNARFDKVDIPASRMKISLARILKEEGFIKNYKCILQRPAPHKSKRGNLDSSILQPCFKLLKRNHIVQRIVKGLKVGIKFFLHVPRQKSKSFSCLNGSPVRTLADNKSVNTVITGLGESFRCCARPGANCPSLGNAIRILVD